VETLEEKETVLHRPLMTTPDYPLPSQLDWDSPPGSQPTTMAAVWEALSALGTFSFAAFTRDQHRTKHLIDV
jgi:hypothetical protein